MKQCTTDNCNERVLAKGLCVKCYYRVKRGGVPWLSKKQQMALKLCSVSECHKPHFANGYCGMHNQRLQRHGDPNCVNPKCNRDGNYKARHKEYYKVWRETNMKSYLAYQASRKKRVKQATPKWADLRAIKDFYMNCPRGYHVDHIIPINGKIVSGLHIVENLQYLTI